MEKQDISFLKQIVNSSEEASEKLEYALLERDAPKLNKIKKMLLNLQKEISKRGK